MKHYIRGEFSLRDLKEVIKVIEEQESHPHKLCTFVHMLDKGALDVQCDANGSCIIEKA